MGATRRLADRMNLARCLPRGELASTEYCLADPGFEYVVLALAGNPVTVDLSQVRGPVAVEWIECDTGDTQVGTPVSGGTTREFTSPFTGDAVLYLARSSPGL